MKQPDNIPEKEWRTPEGYRLHRAEMMARADRRARTRKLLFWLALGVTLILATCANAAEPIKERATDMSAAWARANEIRKACPWPSAYVRAVQGTQSMWPAIDEGCILVMGAKPWAETDKGDVLSMTRTLTKAFSKAEYVDAAVLHRAKVKWVKKDGTKVFVLRGDNNTSDDRWYFGEKEYGATVYAIIRFKDVPWSPSMTLSAWQAKVKASLNTSAASK